MSESLLKKEFKSKDVHRVRNLVKKDYTNKTTAGIGYQKDRSIHSEGDIWEEDGRTWTIKNGIKQNIPKQKAVKKLTTTPLVCPKCKNSMNYWLHEKMYKIHGFCFDCTVEYEAELRKAGLYGEYEKAMITNGIKNFVHDLENWILDSSKQESNYVTEDGEIERWKSNSKAKEKTLENLKKFTEHIKSSL